MQSSADKVKISLLRSIKEVAYQKNKTNQQKFHMIEFLFELFYDNKTLTEPKICCVCSRPGSPIFVRHVI